MTFQIHHSPQFARRFHHRLRVVCLAFLAALAISPAAWAEAPRVLESDQRPADQRLGPLKDLDGYFPFQPPQSERQWAKRAANLRRQMLVALGLWPMPSKTPLNAVIHGSIERDDYTVEKVYFESFPGFFVTGNLYRPAGKSGRLPGVLCPHGHWSDGRFHDASRDGVRRQIVEGAERFEEGGRSPLQARCVQLARMGCVVFHYDMIGYADSSQISFELAHRFAKQRPEMNTTENWGLFSPQAESHLQSIMGLQTYNSIRALDFLCELPDVDPKRLAVTGASGGATQTLMLGAIDPRLAVAFPAVMVSTAMQGGCTCENCCDLRIGTGNVEFAALFAPKPLGMTAADDWTREMQTKGFPELQEHYRVLGKPNHVMLKPLIHFGHNYNYVSRAAMYSWLNKHLKLGLAEPIVEEDYRRLTTAEMSVWDSQHPRPPGGEDFERTLLRRWSEDTERQMAELTPADTASLDEFREVVGGAIDVLIGRRLPDAADIEYEQTLKNDRGDYLEMGGLLRNVPEGEELPIVFLYPKQWDGQVVIWIDEEGKTGLYQQDGQPRAAIRSLLDASVTVVGADLLYQGEFLTDGKPIEKTRRVANPREAAAYTLGYNHSLFAQRVHDILSIITFTENHQSKPERIHLVGLDGAGPLVAAARAQAQDAVDRVAIGTGGFRFAKVSDIHDVNFLPGGAKYGDLPAVLALAAPGRLWLAGEGKDAPQVVQAAYRAASAAENVASFDAESDQQPQAVVRWLLGGE